LELNWSDESQRRMTTEITVWGKKGKIYCNSQEIHVFLKEENYNYSLKQGWNIKYLKDFEDKIDFFVRGEEYSAQLEYFVKKIKSNDYDNINSFEEAAKTDFIIGQINSFREVANG